MLIETAQLADLVADPANVRKHSNQSDRFFSRVSVGTDGCWNFSEIQPHTGYGKFHSNGKTWRAHRWIIWALGFLKERDPICVLHTCDNRRCVNPKHLYLGDRYENAQDIKNRGRTHLIRDPKLGSKNPASRLTEEDVTQIRAALKKGEKGKNLAAKFGVSRPTISEIKNRKRWGHLCH